MWMNKNKYLSIKLTLLTKYFYWREMYAFEIKLFYTQSLQSRVMLPEIHSHVARNFIECLILKKSNNRKE